MSLYLPRFDTPSRNQNEKDADVVTLLPLQGSSLAVVRGVRAMLRPNPVPTVVAEDAEILTRLVVKSWDHLELDKSKVNSAVPAWANRATLQSIRWPRSTWISHLMFTFMERRALHYIQVVRYQSSKCPPLWWSTTRNPTVKTVTSMSMSRNSEPVDRHLLSHSHLPEWSFFMFLTNLRLALHKLFLCYTSDDKNSNRVGAGQGKQCGCKRMKWYFIQPFYHFHLSLTFVCLTNIQLTLQTNWWLYFISLMYFRRKFSQKKRQSWWPLDKQMFIFTIDFCLKRPIRRRVLCW